MSLARLCPPSHCSPCHSTRQVSDGVTELLLDTLEGDKRKAAALFGGKLLGPFFAPPAIADAKFIALDFVEGQQGNALSYVFIDHLNVEGLRRLGHVHLNRAFSRAGFLAQRAVLAPDGKAWTFGRWFLLAVADY